MSEWPAISWKQAINHSADPILLIEISNGVVRVERPDGSMVSVCYYPKSDFFMVRRFRKDGRLGASARYYPEDNGWLKALNYRLPKQYRTI